MVNEKYLWRTAIRLEKLQQYQVSPRCEYCYYSRPLAYGCCMSCLRDHIRGRYDLSENRVHCTWCNKYIEKGNRYISFGRGLYFHRYCVSMALYNKTVLAHLEMCS